MKKKLICLLLCLVFVLGSLVGCGGKSDEEAAENITETASESAITLVMYLMCDEVPSADQQEAITYAVNKITKSKFKTQLDLHFFTEAEYYAKLDAAFAERKAAEAAGLTSTIKKNEGEESAPVEDETIVNDWGVTEIKYPKADSYQVDIFYMGGYDVYKKYADAKMLTNVNSELSGASKLLNDYLFPQYIEYTKLLNGGMDAIPTNAPIGEYTYLLINKEYANEFSYDTPNGYASLTSPTCDALVSFINEVAQKENAVPMYTNLAQYELAAIGEDKSTKFWGVDENGKLTDGFSILGSEYQNTAAYASKDSYMTMGSILGENTAFVRRLTEIKELYSKNYVTDNAEVLAKGDAAVACIKGGADIPDIYSEKYEAVVIENPTFTEADIYSNMFAVTSYSASATRSMKIITHLNTDEEFRNLILYGIEKGQEVDLEKPVLNADGTPVLDASGMPKKTTVTVPANYQKSVYKDVTGHEYTVVERLNKNYMMPLYKTGNVLLAYGEVDKDGNILSLIKKDYVALQNSDAVASTTLGFDPATVGVNYNQDDMKAVREASAEILAKLDAMTYEEIAAGGIKTLTNQYRAAVNAATNAGTVPEEGTPVEPDTLPSFAEAYYKWAKAKGFAPSTAA